MSLKEKVVTATFLSVVPKIIEIWERETERKISFDAFLMNIYNNHKKEDK